jgi:hypothetical protein
VKKNRIIAIPLLIILVNGCNSNSILPAPVVGKPTVIEETAERRKNQTSSVDTEPEISIESPLAPPANVAQSELEEHRQQNKSSAGRYISYLIKEGYKPTVDEYGNVDFKYEGKHYVIIVSENDPEFFRIVLPNIWLIESEKERQKALIAADYATGKIKVVKVLVVRDHVWVSFEVFVSKPEQFQGIFKRSMSALQAATMVFREKMSQ